MNGDFKEKVNESLKAVLPITGIVMVLCVTVASMPLAPLMLFLMGAVLLVVGMGFFNVGADMAMMPIGEKVGKYLSKTGKLPLILISSFFIGALITTAEPDLNVLAGQIPGVPDAVIIWCVAIGVGLFLMISFLRTLLSWNLNFLLILCYCLVFALAAFVPSDFLAAAFDSGGVTTGPITVPFIMALGIGLSSAGKDDSGSNDFGVIGLCSVGPILSVLVLSLIYHTHGGSYTPLSIPELTSTKEVWMQFQSSFVGYGKEVLSALLPVLILFLVFQFFFLRLNRKTLIRITVGIVYTFVGLTLFLTGVNVGFMPAGNYIGSRLAVLDINWILVPLGMLIGFFIVKAEPAVGVLGRQVEDITDGAISRKTILTGLSVSMAASVGLSMVRVLTGISVLWFLIPGYVLALGLSFVVPRIFTAVAFDSGGVASGPMTATFLLPFAMGAVEALGGNVLQDAFGIVAMVAMTPLVTLQIIGLLYRLRTRREKKQVEYEIHEETILELM